MKKIMAVMAAGVVLGVAGMVLGVDWPEYRGANGDAVVTLKAPVEKLNLSPVWQQPIGDSFGEIAVAGDRLALMAEQGDDECLVILNAKTGAEVGSPTRIDRSIKDKDGGNGPRSTPAIDGKRVYVYGTHRKLACVDLDSGKELWMHDVAAEFGGKEPGWGSAVSPRVVGDLVIVVGGGAGNGILAFQKDTGELAWAKTDEKLTHATPTVATIAGTRQVICFMQSGLVSVEPKTGEVLWRFAHRYSTSTAASPVVGGKDGDIVYCSAGYGVGAAACRVTKEGDKWTATELWQTPGKNLSHWSTPVYYQGYVYGLFGHNTAAGPLACLDIETGQVKWSQKNFGSQGGIILLGDKLLVQTPGGDLVLVAASPEGFKELDRKNILKGKNWTAPTYVDGMIFARNSSQGGAKVEVVSMKLGD